MSTPRQLSDRYELGEVLGWGGMSEVFRARDLRLHRDVAVKLLRADLGRDADLNLRFQREAQNVAALNHPCIAAVYDSGEVDTPTGFLPYIVMEYVDGLTLRDVLRMHGPMHVHRAVEVIAKACEALYFSHQRGIIHRDVKPANIMLSHAGAVKVVDFGIAKAIAESGGGVTQTGAVVGTAQYLSPEQARGGQADSRADIYSLGCVLYEIITGAPPFVGESQVAIAYQHVREQAVPPSSRKGHITPDLDAVVLKAMAKSPDQRYRTAEEMRTDLMRVRTGQSPFAVMDDTPVDRTAPLLVGASVDGTPTEQHATSGSEESRSRSGRRWASAAAVAVMVAVTAVFATNFVDDLRDVAVPDVRGQTSAEAIASLRNHGFQPRLWHSVNDTVPPDHVIRTVPEADTAAGPGAEVTVHVSKGPERQGVSDLSTAEPHAVIPDVSTLSYAEAIRVLTDAGFARFQQSFMPSPPELEDRVVGTNPPANRSIPTTDEVTVVLGSGPRPAGG